MVKRIEDKNYIKESQILDFKQWIVQNKGFEIFKKRKIRSIYFDNSKFDCFFDSEEGITPRKKIRIRNYPDDKVINTRTLEIKINGINSRKKLRKVINHDNYINILNNFYFDDNYGYCLPIVYVQYFRQYYEVLNHRVTIDTDIQYSKYRSMQFKKDNRFIIEVKNLDNKEAYNTNNFFPFEKIRFSKYCRAVRYLNLANF